ncbi:AraC family transcriptional regulator [Neobacillus cucumis]|uniref:AraC family transcriptional regulator n=1 Tax=Neobacillus cucumis TaxID=1740721 RepID=A0A2N5HR83_9BACI|nr:AraC family transcriptional regulator [Neobacillus cucumis]PLS08022.1 AraC family transcriptional regulator [Neobacillus cucumis]
MIHNKTLHILNGQAMFDFYQETNFLKGEIMAPFNEAMCYGSTSKDLFSQEFIERRAKVHHVTAEQYTDHTLKPLRPLFQKEFTQIKLWFDADMFCQINLLTILAWLDRMEYKEKVEIHIVGERFEPLSHFIIKADGYNSIYKQVLIDKTFPADIQPASLKRGVELYLNYLHKDSDLMQYIEKNRDVPEKELVWALINEFRDYGLGDTQYLEIIKNRPKNQ